MARPSCSKLLSLLLILPFVSLVASICYCVRDNDIFDCSSTETACGNASSVDTGAQLCCVNGDQCGADSICHFSKPIANTSGYYLGGCTDPTYNDPVCQKHCTDGATADIVYNSNTELWSCCAYPNNTVSCQDPTDITFQAIPINNFPGTSSAAPSSSTTSSSSTSSSTSSSMSTSSSAITGTAGAISASGTATASQSSSPGLSSGAIAGIAVAAVLIGLAIIAGLAFIFIRRRRRAAAEADAAAAANMPGYFDTPGYSGSSPPIQVEGMSEIYTPKQDPNAAANGYHSSGKPDALHESDSRPVLAQLYGSEHAVTELP